MNGLLFAHPEWLSPLFAAVVAVSFALLWASARGRRRLRALAGEGDAVARRAARRAALRDTTLLLALLLLAIGMIGPRLGERTVLLSTSGVDVVLLLDVSRSMDARDTPPTRFDAARSAARSILDGLAKGDQAALSVFAGRGVLLTPLTSDLAALREMIAVIDTSLVKPGGSELALGIEAALEAFDPGSDRPRAILVLTDGESSANLGEVAAARADVRVFGVAIGSEPGATIPDHGAVLRDGAGEVITTRRQLASLEKLTRSTRGDLFVADEWGHFDSSGAIEALRSPVAATPGDYAPHRVTVPVVLPFAAVAFALLVLEWLPLSRRLRGRDPVRPPPRALAPKRRERPVAAAIVLTSLLALAPRSAPPRDEISQPKTAAELVRLGLTQAKARQLHAAERSFLAAAVLARNQELAALAYYNLGVTALRIDELEIARNAFFDALAASPGRGGSRTRREAQWNLEWTLAKLAARAVAPPPAPAPPGKQPTEKERAAGDEERRRGEEEGRGESGGSDEQSKERQEKRESRRAAAEDAEERDGESRGAQQRSDVASQPAKTPALSEQKRAAWLERVEDDPRKALLSAAFDDEATGPRRPGGAPTW